MQTITEKMEKDAGLKVVACDDPGRMALGFRWVPGRAGLPWGERADSLAEARMALPVAHILCPLAPTIAKIRHTLLFVKTEIFFTTPSPARFLRFPRRNWPFPVSSAVNCLDFAATVTAFFCSLTYAG